MLSSDSFQYVVNWNICVILQSKSGHINEQGTLKISDKTRTIMFKTFLALFKFLHSYYCTIPYFYILCIHNTVMYSVMVYTLHRLSQLITVHVAMTCGSMCLHLKLCTCIGKVAN